MAMNLMMNLAKLPVWIIVAIHVFHFGAGETFKWFKSGCSNYTIHANSDRLDWEQSRQLCKKTGLGDLVSIESYAEWLFLKNTILKLTIADEYFIGLRRDDRNRPWRWLSNKSTSKKYLPWATGEPSDDGNCANMYKDYRKDYGKYNDLKCTGKPKPGYICEFPVDRCNQEDGDKRCSCYTFENDMPMPWPQAEGSCKFKNKHLVVMETEREWEFINKEIQTRNSSKESEWHIGLYRNLTTKKWTWINGKTVVINKWQKDKPQGSDFYTVMSKGLFSSIKGNVNRGWICEEKTDNCQGVCLIHNPEATDSKPPGTTKPTTQWRSDSSTAYARTTTSDSTVTSSAPGVSDRSKDDNDGSSTIVIVAASLGAILFIALIVLAVVLLLRRRKRRGHGKDDETPPKKSTQQPAQIGENQYEPVDRVEVAKLLGTPDNNKAEKETEHESPSANCEYAVVNKKNKKRKEGDLVYAQLAEFDGANNDKTAQKPPSYEPTVYADVDVVPPEVFNSTSVDSTQPTYANVQTTGV